MSKVKDTKKVTHKGPKLRGFKQGELLSDGTQSFSLISKHHYMQYYWTDSLHYENLTKKELEAKWKRLKEIHDKIQEDNPLVELNLDLDETNFIRRPNR